MRHHKSSKLIQEYRSDYRLSAVKEETAEHVSNTYYHYNRISPTSQVDPKEDAHSQAPFNLEIDQRGYGLRGSINGTITLYDSQSNLNWLANQPRSQTMSSQENLSMPRFSTRVPKKSSGARVMRMSEEKTSSSLLSRSGTSKFVYYKNKNQKSK